MLGIHHLLALDRGLVEDVSLPVLDALDADRLDADTSDEAWEAAQRRMDKEPDFVPVSGPVSEPVVKRGPGRPPKVRDAEG